jgi:NitT/TauT family transport system permease protein
VVAEPRPQGGGLAWPAAVKKRYRSTLISGTFLLLILLFWQIYSAYMPPVLVPSPQRVALRFIAMWSDPVILSYGLATFWHVVASVTLAFVFGLGIALLAYLFPVFRGAVHDRIAPFLNSFPGIGWAFLALVWFGINSGSVIVSSALALLPLAIINLGAGLRELDKDVLEMAHSFTRNTPKRIRMVMLPLMFPYMFATIRLCFGVSWQIVLIVELLCGASGLGSMISVARQRYLTDMIFAVALLLLAIVFLTDRLVFARLQNKIGKTFNV